MKVALDAMGGDYAPREIVLGAVAACRELNAHVILVGREDEIKRELQNENTSGLNLEIYPASEIIAMDEHPAGAVKKKKDSSLVVANRLVKEGYASAVISAGNTGAAMTASLLTIGRISGIKRPAIASTFPTVKGICVLLDVGANADCEPENLVQFALMGSVYAEKVWGLSNPKVGLLNIGEEETKGNKLAIESYPLLKQSGLDFIGNIESRDIFKGECDVVVCDGFVGNVVLKLAEGAGTFLFDQIKAAVSSSILTKLGGLFVRNAFQQIKARLDYAEYGGMVLLGIDGVSIISHGSSNAKAVKNAVRAAVTAINQGVVPKISAVF